MATKEKHSKNSSPADVVRRLDKKKKERVIHTRVPAMLEEELKRFADNLRVPVSNLIRTVLEDAVAMADTAAVRLSDKLLPRNPLAGISSFQPLKLSHESDCVVCDKAIASGKSAFLGLGAAKGRHVVVCGDCLPASKSA